MRLFQCRSFWVEKGNAFLPGYRAHKVVLGFALAVGAILGKEFSEVLLPVNVSVSAQNGKLNGMPKKHLLFLVWHD